MTEPKLERQYLELLTLEGWVRRYWEMIADYETMEQTYEAIERQHEGAFGKRKYSDFQSFRNCFYRFEKNKNNSK